MPNIIDTSIADTPGWWLDRLSTRLDWRTGDMNLYADYYAGVHRMQFATQKFREAFGSLFGTVHDNFCSIIVDKLVERLEVQGFRFGNADAETVSQADDTAWAYWQANGLDADFAKGIREGLTKGEFAMTVWADRRGKPRMTVEDPLNVIVATDPADRRIRRAALKRWYDPDFGQVFATLYMPDAIWKFQSTTGISDPRYDITQSVLKARGIAWEPREVPGEAWPLPNALGVVPVVAFANKPDLAGVGVSELRDIVSIQDSINKLLSDLLVAAEFGAFRQRYAVNVVLEVDENTGRAVEPWKIAADRLLTAPPPLDPSQPEVRFGEFSQTDLGPYITSIEMLLRHAAVISRMPPHYLLGGSAVFPSAESLRSAETGLIRKARDRMRDLSEPLEEVMRLAFEVTGDRSLRDVEVETLWADPETRTESEHIDALVKMKSLGVPEKGLWPRIPASPSEIDHWEALLAEQERAAVEQTTLAPAPDGSLTIMRRGGTRMPMVDPEEATDALQA